MRPISRLSKQSVETADVLDGDQILYKRGGGKGGRMLLVELSVLLTYGGSMVSLALTVIYQIFRYFQET